MDKVIQRLSRPQSGRERNKGGAGRERENKVCPVTLIGTI